MQLLSLAIRLVVLCTLLWLAVVDVRTRRLPNRIVLAIAFLFFADAAVLRMPVMDVLGHLLTGAVVLVICAGLFAAGMLGGGDAKLAAVIYLWVGLHSSWPTFFLISVAGAIVAAVSIATRHVNPQHRLAIMRVLALFSGDRGVPYGVALAVGGGTVIALPALLSMFLTR